MMKYLVIVVLIGVTHMHVCAQYADHGYPRIGQRCPDFTLRDIHDYHVDSISLSELSGRHVILDFWHRYCAACISSFPKMNELAKKFQGKVDIFMVGLEDDIGLGGLYRELNDRYNLRMAAAHDSSLFNRFVPGRAAPHIVMIDTNGVVKAVTNSLDEIMLKSFIDGKDFDFVDRSYDTRFGQRALRYDPRQLYSIDGNGGQLSIKDIRSRSLLLHYRPGDMPVVGKPKTIDDILRLSETLGSTWFDATFSVLELYRLAYIGKVSWDNRDMEYERIYSQPILKNGGQPTDQYESVCLDDVFWYSLCLPKKQWTKEFIVQTLKDDLYRAFGFSVKVDVREMPYWKVVSSAEALDKLKTKGRKPNHGSKDNLSVKSFTNQSFDEVIRLLFRKVSSSTLPVLNETGFSDRIDMEFKDGLGFDFEIIRKELELHGIFLVKGYRKFKVLVIDAN